MSVWKSIPGGFSMYEVSNYGKLRNKRSKYISRAKPTKIGYIRVNIVKDDGTKPRMGLHILVALAFIPNPENLPFVDHINNTRHDNRFENLRWSSASLNAKNRKTNSRSGRRKIEQINKDTGEVIKVWDGINQATLELGIKSNSNISGACRGIISTAGG